MIRAPEVYLFGKPADPVRAMMQTDATAEEFTDFLNAVVPMLDTDPLQPHPFDRVRFSFLLLNVSRAFQQQLTRHRIDFSYSIQSLRMANVGEFATESGFTMPQDPNGPPPGAYREAMQASQDIYNVLVEGDAKTEDARGILPLNIHSPVSFSATLRAIHAMLRQRLCLATQGEFRAVADGIKMMIHEYNSFLGGLLLPHCSPDGICKMRMPDCKKVVRGICKLPE